MTDYILETPLKKAPQAFIVSKFELGVAQNIADNLIALLGPYCEKLNIAGSIRRQKPLVKDIELVCVPKKVFIQTELFGNGIDLVVPEFKKTIEAASEKIVKGNIDGRYMQVILKNGIVLDLFLPKLSDYYRQFAIRTGSGDYSRYIIASAWRKKGWCGTDSGLRRITDCYKNGTTWKCYNENAELPPVWHSEEEFFDWLGVKCVNPSERNV